MNKTLLLASAAACMALAGCFGGGGGGGGSTAAQISQTYDDLGEGISNGAITAVEDMPTGEASMSGHIGFSDNEDEGYALGALALDVDFGSGDVSGTAGNFAVYDADDNKQANISGTLAVAGGVTGNTLSANATGTLSDGTDPADVALTMDGQFYDDDGDLLVYGDVGGTLTGSDYSDTVEGGFYAYED